MKNSLEGLNSRSELAEERNQSTWKECNGRKEKDYAIEEKWMKKNEQRYQRNIAYL